jgi:hypothetical protein
MNFMVTPHQCLIENTRFTEEELSSAISVFNELVYLGPIAYVPDGYQLSNNFPLFLAPKPGKPGRHRCIADMKQGNQNAAIGKDPFHLYQPQDMPLPCYLQKIYRSLGRFKLIQPVPYSTQRMPSPWGSPPRDERGLLVGATPRGKLTIAGRGWSFRRRFRMHGAGTVPSVSRPVDAQRFGNLVTRPRF